MNRELKFRFFDKTRKKMFYQEDCSTLWLGLDGEIKAIDCDAYPLSKDQFEIMQYTGLKDKQGVEIYDCDLVEYKCNHCDKIHIGKIIWHPLACWGILTSEGDIFPLQIPINPKDLEEGLGILPIQKVIEDQL